MYEEGRVVLESTWKYEYVLRDYLGNTRVVFRPSNGTTSLSVEPTHAYYPFGMKHEELTTGSRGYDYRYNGKELNEELGLYDYGARWYDPAIARWGQVDPLASSFPGHSPYNYVMGNPISLVDPDGRMATGPGDPPSNSGFLFKAQNYVAGKLNGALGTKIPLWDENGGGGSETSNMVVNGVANTTLGVLGVAGAVLAAPETISLGGAVALTTLFVASAGEAVVGMSQLADVVINDADPNSSLHQSETIPGIIAKEMGSEYAGAIDAGVQVLPALMTGGLKGATGIGDMLEAFGAIRNGDKVKGASKAFTAKDAAGDLRSFTSEVNQLIVED